MGSSVAACTDRNTSEPVDVSQIVAPDTLRVKSIDDIYGNYRWTYSDDHDEMSGKKNHVASLYTKQTFMLSGIQPEEQRGHLIVRNHPRHGQDVILTVRSGILMHDYIIARFNDRPMRRFSASESATGDYTMLFVNDSKGFIRELKNSDSLRIEARFYNDPTVLMRFNTAELIWP